MSKVIDERVVSMQFDNRHFESNVKTTMSTLDRLKAALNFKDAGRSLQNINSAATKCNLSPLSNAVDNVGLRFNAMYTIADQALRNITNSAMAAGKNIINALTIDPVKTGLSEYETQINSVQTILANTSHQGTTIDDVNKALDELNTYADQTIYNFTEMTRNIGTFTAAGLDLKTSTKAIQGIANLAAVSGSTSQQASTAMYQLSQALSSGTIRLMDWNSVVNAGMGGKVFQDAIIETAKGYGELTESAVAAYKSGENFRNLLNPKDYGDWFTSDILAETLQKFTKSGSVEYLAKVSNASEDSIKELQELGDTVGYDSEQFDEMAKSLANGDEAMTKTIKDVLTMANTATDAATKVKTFSQMWDVMKETAQSGWSQTWKIIFGDFEEAKAIFTPLTNFFTNIINKISDARNTFLKAALGSPFGQLGEKIANFTKPVGDAVEALGDYSEIVDRIISGEFGNGQERWDKLTEMGYNWAHAQNLVNEKLGNSFRRVVELTEAQGENAVSLENLTDEKLKDLGLTEAEIAAYRELERQAKETGKPISELIESLETRSGRDLLIDSVKNFGSALTSIAGAAGKAWREIFDPIKPESLYTVIDSFEEFTAGIKEFWKNADNLGKLTRVFKGLFAAIDIIGTISGGAIKFVFNVISEVLNLLDADILGAAANIGDAVVALRDWIDECTGLKDAAKSVAKFVVSAAEAVKSWFTALREAENIPAFIANGILSGIKFVIDAIVKLGTSIIDNLRGVLDEHSPSRKAFEAGWDFVLGFWNAIKAGASLIWGAVKDIGTKALEAIKSIDYNKLISVLVLGGVLVGFLKIANAIKNFSKPFEAAGEVLDEAGEVVEGVADTVKNFAKVVKSYSGLLKAKAVKELAIAIGIVVGAVALLSFLKADKLKNAVIAISILAAVLVAMSFAISLLNKIPSVDFGKTSLVILSVSMAAVLMASAMKKLEGLDANKWKQTVYSFAVAVGALGVLITAIGLTFGLTKLDIGKVSPVLFKLTAAMAAFVILCKVLGSMDAKEAQQGAKALAWLTVLMGALMGFSSIVSVYLKVAGADAGALGSSMIKMSIALLAMAGVVKILSTMTEAELGRGYGVLLGLTGVIALLTLITKLAGKNNFSALGSTLLKMSVAMGIMFSLIGLIGKIPQADFDRGYGALLGLVGIVALLTAVTRLIGGNDFSKMGGTLMQMSVAMAILGVVIKIVGGMDQTAFDKGYAALFGLSAMIAILVGITRLAGGNDLKKVGSTVMSMSVSMMILAGACALLSVFNQNGGIQTAANALVMISMAMTLMMLATKDMKDCKGNIIAMTAAIVAISVALAALSFIAASDPASLGVAALCLAGLMAVFGLMTKLMGHATAKIAPLLVMTAAVGVLGGLLYLLTSLPDPSKAIDVAAALSIVMIALAGAMAIAGRTSGAGGGLGLLAASAGILAISAALWVLAGIPWQQLAIGIGALVIALAAIVGAGVLLTMFAPGVAALTGVLLAFSAIILSVGVAMLSFSGSLYIAGLALPLIGEGFAMLGEGLKAFIITIASCYENAGKFIVTMLSLSAGVIVFSVALAVAAIGVTVFSVALIALGAGVLVASIGALGFAAALYVVGLALPLIADGFAALGVGLNSFVTNVATCKDSMNDFASVMTTMGSSILVFLLKLSAGLGVVSVAAIAVGVGCVALAAGLALVGVSIVVVAAGVLTLGAAFVVLGVGAGVAALGILAIGAAIALAINWVVSAVFNIGEQAKTAGTNLVQGFANGITSAIETVKNAVGGFVNSCISTICELLGIHSPSLVAYQLGTYTGDGFALGLDDSTEKVNQSATNLANSAQTSMETAGTEGSTSFMDSLGDGIDLSSIDVGSLDMTSLKSTLGGAGTAGGTSFMTGLTDKLGTSSIDIGSMDLSSLTESFGGAGKDSGSSFLSSFSDSLSGSKFDIGSLDLSSLTSKFGDSGKEAAASFSDGVNSSANEATLKPSITKMLSEASSSAPKFKQVGVKLVTTFAMGIKQSSNIAVTNARSMANSAASAVTGKSSNFYSAGASLARGFARGIDDFSYLAVLEANTMVNSVVAIVRNGLQINSPSKVFMEIGRSIPEGFAMGISDFGTSIVDSSIAMADVAIAGTRDAISRVAEAINTDIDSQPTIRPVLDLSDVESGASAINGMFGMQPSLELLTNVGSINSMMNTRQNGVNTTNDDVVAAIKDLKTAITESSGDSYSINGITYDDGSNIASTIKSLVRASRIEGRI